MEYSLYVNQRKAVEWDLSMGQALLFSYLINSTAWMSRHPKHTDFVWCSNASLARELPLLCKHKDSAKRHMSDLEKLGLIDRITDGNKSYFCITSKGFTWKSDTIRSDETARPEEQGRTDLPYKSDETARPRPDETAPQSDIPITPEIQDQKNNTVGGVVLPGWMPADLWNAAVAARRSMKKHPMSREALDLLVIAVAKCRDAGHPVEDILTALIENGWRTVKPEWLAKLNRPEAPASDETLEERVARLDREMFGDPSQPTDQLETLR